MLEMSLEKEPADVVFMDPPRAGSDRTFLSSLIALSPQKVVYISCNPETQQRDLRYLTSKGPYRVTRIQPVDMFPHTNHVETVACFKSSTIKNSLIKLKRRKQYTHCFLLFNFLKSLTEPAICLSKFCPVKNAAVVSRIFRKKVCRPWRE